VSSGAGVRPRLLRPARHRRRLRRVAGHLVATRRQPGASLVPVTLVFSGSVGPSSPVPVAGVLAVPSDMLSIAPVSALEQPAIKPTNKKLRRIPRPYPSPHRRPKRPTPPTHARVAATPQRSNVAVPGTRPPSLRTHARRSGLGDGRRRHPARRHHLQPLRQPARAHDLDVVRRLLARLDLPRSHSASSWSRSAPMCLPGGSPSAVISRLPSPGGSGGTRASAPRSRGCAGPAR
jgi:hypothetical protein